MLIDLTDVPFTQEQGRYNVYRDEIAQRTGFEIKHFGLNGDLIDLYIAADLAAESLAALASLKIKVEQGTFTFNRIGSNKYRVGSVLRSEFKLSQEVVVPRETLKSMMALIAEYNFIVKSFQTALENTEDKTPAQIADLEFLKTEIDLIVETTIKFKKVL